MRLNSTIIHPSIRANVPLAPYTTWRIGGPARLFWEPASLREVSEVLRRCSELGVPVYFLGRGSNVLINDGGLDGLVICMKRGLQRLEHVETEEKIVAEAGVPLPKLSKLAASLGYGGYEFLIGIPGTVGGGVVINAGLTNRAVREIGSALLAVTVVTLQGEVKRLATAELGLGYRTSALLDAGILVAEAEFALRERCSQEEIRTRTREHLVERKRKQPLTKPTAGSTFRQPANGHAAGWYIDRAGLKGFRIGQASVSEKHGNWIVNHGQASALDVKQLIDHVQDVVHERFDIELEREVRFLPEDCRWT